jgi:hypothetical protein
MGSRAHNARAKAHRQMGGICTPNSSHMIGRFERDRDPIRWAHGSSVSASTNQAYWEEATPTTAANRGQMNASTGGESPLRRLCSPPPPPPDREKGVGGRERWLLDRC